MNWSEGLSTLSRILSKALSMSGVNNKNRIIVGEFLSSIAVYEFSRIKGGYNLIACEYGVGRTWS